MRIPLVPATAIAVGLALIAAPPFFPVHVDQAVLPEGMAIGRALEITSVTIVLAGALSVLAGIALCGRRAARRDGARIQAWLFTGVAALFVCGALLLAAAVPAVMAEWGMRPALGATSAWSYLLGVSLALAALILVSRRLIRRPRANTAGTQTSPRTGLALAGLFILTASPALAISLGEMAEEAGQDLEIVPFFISIAFYILGVLIVGFGLIRLKRHVDHPSQTTIGSGIVALLIGTALLAAPSIINSVGETFGVDSTATLSRPALD